MSGGTRVSELYVGGFGSSDSQMHERERVHWVCSQVSGVRVLEVGASQGIVSILLAREGFEVVGTEVEEASYEFAVEALAGEPDAVRGRLEFVLTDGSLDEFDDGSFDTVILGEVVEHLVQPERLLGEVERVLAPGGRLVLTTTVGLYPDVDHKESLFPSDLIGWFGEGYEYVDSTFITFPLGRFNNIGLTMTKRDGGGDTSRAGFMDPLLSIAEQALWEVQQGAESLRVDSMELRELLGEARTERNDARRNAAQRSRELATAKEQIVEVRKQIVEVRKQVGSETQREIDSLHRQLRDSFEVLASVYGSMDRMFHELPDQTPNDGLERLAQRLVETQNQLAATEYQLEDLRTWRGVRVGIALAESAHPKQFVQLPKRLREASQPVEPAPIREPVTTGDVLTGAGIEPGSLRRGVVADYPHLRVAHHGGPATYRNVAPHKPIDPTRIEEYVGYGADLLLIEPSPNTQPLTDDALRLYAEAGIPIVVYARTIADLDTHATGNVTLIVTDSPSVAQAAKEQAHDTPVLHINPSIDDTIYNPIGFQRDPEHGPVIFLTDPPRNPDLANDRVILLDPVTDLELFTTPATDRNQTAIPATGVLTDPTQLTDTIKHHTAVIDSVALHHTETGYLQQLLRYGATGTPIITTGSPNLSNLIPLDLIHLPATPHDTTTIIDNLANDTFERERHSIALRRHILANHTHRHRFDEILDRLDIPTPKPDVVSIMFVTNRPDFLEHAYTQIQNQEYPHKELITVLHGDDFDPDLAKHLNTTCDFPTTLIQAPTKWTLGDCLNTAIDHATGDLLTKMDDDDYYGKHHLTDLTQTRHYTNADIIGKPAEFVYLSHLDLTVFRETNATERFNGHIGGPTITMTSRAAHELRFSLVRSGVDVTLYERARPLGYTLYSTHPFEFVLNRHGAGHTWDPDDSHFLEVARATWPGLPEEDLGV
jgi:SAM-dependent methyltransferase